MSIPATVAPADGAATATGLFALSELHAGDVLAGRFHIDAMLGIGGMGVVYRAHDLALDVDVAIKLLRPELARKPEAFERFRQELLLARQVSSPHVVRIHDIAEDSGRWFISMDFIDGESLEHRLDTSQRLPVEQTLKIAHGLLEGLAAAHLRGVVHRDLKPANILIDRSECAFITDFGVARSLGSTGLTQSGMIVGTPEYLSPEQARGEAVDARSDLYAVGLILYEMLVGSLPFAGGTPVETVIQRIVRQPPSLAKARPDLPHWLHAFCDRLLKLASAHRFASATDALRALDTRRVPRQPLNRPAILLGVLTLVALVGAAEWLHLHPLRAIAPDVALASATPSVALLPLSAPVKDAALARALDAHLVAWLRGDTTLAVVPRRRVLQALARTAPDAHGADLLRLLPVIAGATHADRLLHGELGDTDGQLHLQLRLLDSSAKSPATPLDVRGANAAALYSAYLADVPAWLAAVGIRAGTPPTLPAAELPVFGQALLDLDHKQPEAAAQSLAAQTQASGALYLSALLRAEDAAGQELPAQNTRAEIVARFAHATDVLDRELYALALTNDGQDDAAARARTQALKEYPHDAGLILALADSLRAQGQGAHAQNLLKKYLQKASDDADAWFLLGRTAIEQGDARVAVEDYLLHAQTLATLARDRAGEALVRNAIGIGYERLGQLDAAADEYQRAATIREQLGDRTQLAKTLRNLAIVQAELGRRDEAERNLDKVKTILDALGDRASNADLQNDRGVVAEESGDFAAALSHYRQAYALRQQLNDPALVAESLNNIGFCSYRMGDFDNAAVYWKQALEQYQKLDDRTGALDIQQSMALLDLARGRFDTARRQLEDSLRYAQAHLLPEEEAVADTSLAELALLQGHYADATSFASEAARLFARRADQRGRAEAAILGARVALALGDTATADKALQAINPKQLNREQTAEFLLASARYAGLAGDRGSEITRLNDAAAAAAHAHSGALETRIGLERAKAELAGNDLKRAGELLDQIGKQATRMNDVPVRLRWLELKIALALRTKNHDAAAARYREVLPLLKSAGDYADAWLLHKLGAAALVGQGAEAAAAQTAAQMARAHLLALAAPTSRPTLTTELERREQELEGSHDN